VGLDPDVTRMPTHMQTPDQIELFLTAIIHATRPFAAAFKINTAFFEQYGILGMQALYAVRDAVGGAYCIIDAKRADIGNTSAAYARALFNTLSADAVTVVPYMGADSVEPFLELGFTYLLALTSNPGSADFQRKPILTPDGVSKPLHHHVMELALGWEGAQQLGFVVGATHAAELSELRGDFPAVPFLIPGIGAQGASAHETAAANSGGPALYNVSRNILYASAGKDFAEAAAQAASDIQTALST
jgi:orotidine-5'-phosphate decarboxylase